MAEPAQAPAIDERVRSRLALAIDVDDLVPALRLARELKPWFSVAKVGLELYSAAGPDAVITLVDAGFKVFADVKLHDIPTTVYRTAHVFGGLGASYLTIHTLGGRAMVEAGVQGLAQGASDAGMDAPIALGVTVLTSEPTTDEVLEGRVHLAAESGCGGVVCAAPDLAVVRRLAPLLQAVVPGIRPAGVDDGDQLRTSTPAAAVAAGADLLVIGRAVTAAPDRIAAAQSISREVSAVLDR